MRVRVRVRGRVGLGLGLARRHRRRRGGGGARCPRGALGGALALDLLFGTALHLARALERAGEREACAAWLRVRVGRGVGLGWG